MDISTAVLFYSKQSQKSLYLKHELEQLDVTIEYVCVDKKIIRETLLENNCYGIREIPSLLLLYQNKEFNTLKGRDLDSWFYQLKENVMKLREQQLLEYQQYMQQQIQEQLSMNTNGIDKKTSDNPGRILSPPGKQKMEQSSYKLFDDNEPQENLIDILEDSPINNEIPVPKKKKNAKEEKLESIRTIQEKLLAERENMERLVEDNKPFI